MNRHSKAVAKGMAGKGEDRSHVTVKKRPVRAILPAYSTSGETCTDLT